MRVATLDVAGFRPDTRTVAPLFRVDDDGAVHPRSPGMVPARDLDDADIAAFPGVWGAYPRAARPAVRSRFDEAADAGLRVVVWVEGDHEIDLDHPAAVLLEHGPDARRRRSATVHATPVLIHDHLANLFGGDVDPVPRGDVPTVGFCGQAAAPWLGHLRLLAGKARQRLSQATGRTDRLPAPWRSHLRLRRRALAALAADPRVDTDYVVRDRYRAGLQTHAERADRTSPTATAFYGNIRRNAYTLCVRGGGNFSTRLYETLCLGRIPIVVDTQQVLPWEGRVPWEELAVRVPADRLDELAERVVAHHAALDDSGFAEAQRRCRELWVEWLSTEGFLRHVPELLT